MSCYIRKFPGEIRNQGWQGGLIATTRDETFWGGWMGVAQDKGGLLVGGQGAPIWWAGVIEKGCRSLIRSIAT